MKFLENADLLIHESTYSHKETEMAYERGHSTATMAAQIAAKANVESTNFDSFESEIYPWE